MHRRRGEPRYHEALLRWTARAENKRWRTEDGFMPRGARSGSITCRDRSRGRGTTTQPISLLRCLLSAVTGRQPISLSLCLFVTVTGLLSSIDRRPGFPFRESSGHGADKTPRVATNPRHHASSHNSIIIASSSDLFIVLSPRHRIHSNMQERLDEPH